MPSRAEELFKLIESNPTGLIDKLIQRKQQENEYIDFKVVAEESSRKKTWAEFLSSYANTEGGILIWGIDARRKKGELVEGIFDAPHDNPEALAQFFRDRNLSLTVPPVENVQILPIVRPDGKGYVVCLVPPGSFRPYRDAEGGKYWMRNKDKNIAIPHDILRAMFYPRSLPDLIIGATWSATAPTPTVEIFVKNVGNVSAYDIEYMTHPLQAKTVELRAYQAFPKMAHPMQAFHVFDALIDDARFYRAPTNIIMTLYMRDRAPQTYEIVFEKEFGGPYIAKNGIEVKAKPHWM